MRISAIAVVEPVFDFFGDAGKRAGFVFQFGDAREQIVAFGDQRGVALAQRRAARPEAAAAFPAHPTAAMSFARLASSSLLMGFLRCCAKTLGPHANSGQRAMADVHNAGHVRLLTGERRAR